MSASLNGQDDDFDVVVLKAMGLGDRRAFDVLYGRHSRSVYRYAWALSATSDRAEELTQDTFVTLWTKRDKVRVVDESALPWLLAVCRNHARNVRRKEARHATVPLDESHAALTGDTNGLEWIRDEIANLSSDDRRICELCLVDGFSYRDAASVLEISTAAAGKRLERARAKLRKAVVSHGE